MARRHTQDVPYTSFNVQKGDLYTGRGRLEQRLWRWDNVAVEQRSDTDSCHRSGEIVDSMSTKRELHE